MFWLLEAIFSSVCKFQCHKMDEIRHHHITTVHITLQTLHIFKFHYSIIIQYYSILFHSIIQSKISTEIIYF